MEQTDSHACSGTPDDALHDMMEAERRKLTRLARGNVDIMEHAQAQDDGQEAVEVCQDLTVCRDALT